MIKPVVLGLDVGTSSVKAVLVDPDAHLVASGRAGYPTRQPIDGRSEQDPEDWRRAAIVAIRDCINGQSVRVEAISLSGHMSAPVLVDEAGNPLGPCHTITDRRSASEIAALPEKIVQALVTLSGNLPATHLILPKLLWWKRHHPEIWARTRTVLMPKDWLRHWLTGELATDPTDAGNSMLFDATHWSWSRDMAEGAGIDPDKLAPLRETQSEAGRLLAGPAAALGLPEGLPVIVGAADMAATLLGTGIDLVYDVALTIGTSATVVAGLTKIEPSLVGAMNINPYMEQGQLYAIGSHFGGGGALNWLASLITGDEQPDPAWVARTAANAAAIEPGSEGLVFLPYLSGAGSPAFDPQARGAFLGLSMKHGRAHMLRAIVEGVTTDVAASIGALARVQPRRRIIFSGGGSRIPFWSQILADVTGLPVQSSMAADASALGAGLIAGVGIGWFGGSLQTARVLAVPSAPTTAPRDLQAGRHLQERFDRARGARRPDRLR